MGMIEDEGGEWRVGLRAGGSIRWVCRIPIVLSIPKASSFTPAHTEKMKSSFLVVVSYRL